MNQQLLQVDNLQVKLDHHLVLDHVNFEAAKNETIAIIGPNGAGKTTLFRALLGLIPYQGKVEWKAGVKIGYVPQRLMIENDLPLTTCEFFALKGKGVNHHDLKNALSLVGFKDDSILNKRLGVLSGGELQRILIAWALVGKPDILLFDEPTAGIDLSAEETIYSLLHQLQERENLTIILISHELQVVYRYADKVICLNKRQVCFGAPSQVLDQASLVKLFGGDVSFYRHH